MLAACACGGRAPGQVQRRHTGAGHPDRAGEGCGPQHLSLCSRRRSQSSSCGRVGLKRAMWLSAAAAFARPRSFLSLRCLSAFSLWAPQLTDPMAFQSPNRLDRLSPNSPGCTCMPSQHGLARCVRPGQQHERGRPGPAIGCVRRAQVIGCLRLRPQHRIIRGRSSGKRCSAGIVALGTRPSSRRRVLAHTPCVPTVPSQGSSEGVRSVAEDGTSMPNRGERTVRIMTLARTPGVAQPHRVPQKVGLPRQR